MNLSPNQAFADPFCRVRLFEPSGNDYNKTSSDKFREDWTREVFRFVDSVELTNAHAGEPLGNFQLVLNPPLEIAKAWLDGKVDNKGNRMGDWLRFGVYAGLTFGYENQDKTDEFMGTLTFPSFDLNPTSPTITLTGPLLKSASWESPVVIDCKGKSGVFIIREKMKQFGYSDDNIEISSDLKGLLTQAYEGSVIASGQSFNGFIYEELPKLLKVIKVKGGKGQAITIDVKPSVRRQGRKIIFDVYRGGSKGPVVVVFQFMGRYNLKSDPQVVVINNFKVPINWAVVDPASFAQDAGEQITDGKLTLGKEDTSSQKVNTQPGPSRNKAAVQHQQNKIIDQRTRYISFRADIDTIGIPTLNVDDIVKIQNVGKIIDDGTWRVHRATHKWSKSGYSSSWQLSCIDIEKNLKI